MPIVRYTPPTLNIYCRRCGKTRLAATPAVAPALTAAGSQHTVLYWSLGGNYFCTLVRTSDWNKKSQKPKISQDILRREILPFINLKKIKSQPFFS